ncbi:hypothetical protein BGZ59_002313 [Podila verticillata]|nr:hypothetical protein BGZ59_002313 [Podila verticillata]KFH71607.1 hypothetical protein MVEG_01905 [Podila verticillata NRRL 6337]
MTRMPRFKLAVVLATALVCLAISSTSHTANAAVANIAPRAEDLDSFKFSPNNDFEDAAGSFVKKDTKIVDEYGDYEIDTTPVTDDSNNNNNVNDPVPDLANPKLGGIELNSEEAQSFFLSLAMIVVSEIGDKTFLIAAIMAMKHPRLLVFSAALSALAIMSVLSAAFGHAVPNLIPRTYTNYLAALLFFCFGIRMIYDGYHMTEEDAAHELEEVTQELQDKEDFEMLQRAEAGANTDENATDSSVLVGMNTDGVSKSNKESSGLVNLFQLLFSPVFVQTFIMTFLAEWGDRSQIATIALAAAHNMVWVSVGAVFGHSLCTGVAVIGGRMLATRISVRTVTLFGAVVFEIFAVISLYEAYYE